MSEAAKIRLILFLLLSIFSASCSMQKRVYNRGFHIEWNEGRSNENEGKEMKALKAQKATKLHTKKEASSAGGEHNGNNIKDTIYFPPSFETFVKQKASPSAFYKTNKKVNAVQKKTKSLLPVHLRKKDDVNYYEYPNEDVSAGLGGFLTSLVALLILFGANSLLWGLLLLVIALTFCIIGIVQQIDEPDTTDLIFAVLGLCICGFTIFLFLPVIGPLVTFFIANPGVLLCLLLILGIYLLMNA